MARSAHAYVRGSTVKFYEWLNSDGAKRVPDGPAVWICGDCHLGNLAPVANSDGQVRLAIRDLFATFSYRAASGPALFEAVESRLVS